MAETQDGEIMIGSFYFWKWADNDLSGKPADVYASLMRGQLHPALQPFDARPLLRALQKLATKGRKHGEEWDLVTHPALSPHDARFVFVTCPAYYWSKAPGHKFFRRIDPLVSGYDEQRGIILPGFPPKLNCFIHGQFYYERSYDISEEDLPVMLRQIRPKEKHAFGILKNRCGQYVQCFAKGRRFVVEWRETQDDNKFDHWKAQDRDRLSKLDGPYHPNIAPGRDPDLLRYSDALRIFREFMRGKPRPAHYHWLNINDLLK